MRTTNQKTETWREALLIPKGFGDREGKPRSTRWPKDVIKRVEAIGVATGHDYTTALFHLVTWACDEYDRQRAEEKKSLSTSK